ncbi:MAG TPA: serine/threonine-protein kinase [Gemmatimonadota bacterium]|nr:serine/threonine-protein kinase [Gemmatimonadota bacterium]
MRSPKPDLWLKIEAALGEALNAPPGERAAILQRACGDDDFLRKEVESLLDAHQAASGFLDTSAESFATPYLARAATPDSTDDPGMMIGRYLLVEEIGRGGMGTVWLAQRADGQFEQRVALKLVKRGMDTEEILARFLRERQILARLEHPNIARLLDGGVSDDGRPYFVMEYVRGVPITEHCDLRNLSIEDRIRLFTVVCRAIVHAHRNLVVHRDIKPSNVLVDESGEIKLLDFGIARLLADEEANATQITRGNSGFLTPQYASPEQLTGGRVTTASDVYQLGALLYELLSGHCSAPHASRHQDEVRRPSTAIRSKTGSGGDAELEAIDPLVIAQRRGTSPDRLKRRLRGDLDTITLRALRTEPERRYPSAEALAEDVERHLSSLPIRYGGDRVSYRARKFIRRHRLGVGMAVGALTLTIGLLAVDMARVRAERDRARYEADKATETAQLMGRFLQGWSPDASDRGEVSAQKMLGEAAIRAERELRGRPEMLAATLSILGDFHTTLGEWRTADSLLTRALRIQTDLSDEPNADLAATLYRRGRLFRYRGHNERAEDAVRRSLALHRANYGPTHIETLRVQRELAIVLRQQRRYAESEQLLRDLLASISEADRSNTPFALEASSELGYALFNQARFDEAVEVLRPALERQREIFGEVHASTLFTIRSLGSAYRDQGDLDQAEALYRDALRVARALYGEEHIETEAAIHVLALVLDRKEKYAEAETYARRNLELARRIYGPGHIWEWGRVGHIGVIRLERGDEVEAERLLRRALAGSRRFVSSPDPDLGDVLNRLAYIVVKREAGDTDAIYDEAVAVDGARPLGSALFVTDGIHYLAWAEHLRGDLAAAQEDYRRALGLYRRHLPNGHSHRAAAATGFGAVLLDQGRLPEATRYLREGLAQWEAHAPVEPDRIREVHKLLARADSAAGRESTRTLTGRAPRAP